MPSPIDVQVVGFNLEGNRTYAAELLDKFRHIPGIADLRVQQSFDYPELHVDVDRSRAQDLGLSQVNVANNMLVALSGSFQTAPSFWLSPKTGVTYNVVTQTPQRDLDSIQALEDLPINNPANGQAPKLLRAVARVSRGVGPAIASHYNVQPVIDLFAATQDRDLGGCWHRHPQNSRRNGQRFAERFERGGARSNGDHDEFFRRPVRGLAFAIVLVYLLIVVNFSRGSILSSSSRRCRWRWPALSGCCL